MKNDQLDNLFKLIPETDIYACCKKLAYQDENIANALLKHFKKDLPSPEVIPNQKKLEREIDNCFKHLIDSHGGYYDSGFDVMDWEAVGKDLDRVVSKLDQLCEMGHGKIVAELVLYTLQQIDDNFEDYLYDEYDFDFGDLHAEELMNILCKAIGSGTVPDRTQLDIAEGLDALDESLAFDHVDFDDIVHDIRERLLTDDERIGILKEKFEQENEGYRKERAAVMLWDYLIALGRRDEAISFYRKHNKIVQLRDSYVQLLEDEGELQEAIRVIDEGIALEQPRYGLNKGWEEDKLRIYEKMKDRAKIISQAEKLFVYGHPVKEYYRHLKKAYDPDKWAGYLRELIGKKEFGMGFNRDLAEIYRAEGWTEDLFQYLKKLTYGFFDPFCQYAKLFSEEQQAELLVKIENYFRNRLANTMPRKEYHDLTDDLISLRKTCPLGAGTAQKLVNGFRAAYQKRPALIDELKRFGK